MVSIHQPVKLDRRLAPERRQRRLLLGGSLIVVLSSVTTLAIASQRIKAEEAAFSAPAAGRCVPSTLNRSAVLPGTSARGDAAARTPTTRCRARRSACSARRPARSPTSACAARSAAAHAGELRAYSQGDGASFVPSAPFVSGETVTVRGTVATGGARTQPSRYHFVVAREDVLPHPPSRHPYKDPNEKMHFHSRPDLEPPCVVVTARSSPTAPGDIFTAPYNGPGQAGPMIFDEAGNLVWFNPLPAEARGGRPAGAAARRQTRADLVAGLHPAAGLRRGRRGDRRQPYRQIGRVHAGNGYKVDLHEFHITPQGTAVLTAFKPIRCDLSIARRAPRRAP